MPPRPTTSRNGIASFLANRAHRFSVRLGPCQLTDEFHNHASRLLEEHPWFPPHEIRELAILALIGFGNPEHPIRRVSICLSFIVPTGTTRTNHCHAVYAASLFTQQAFDAAPLAGLP